MSIFRKAAIHAGWAAFRAAIQNYLAATGVLGKFIAPLGVAVMTGIALFSGLSLGWKLIIILLSFAAIPTGVYYLAKIIILVRHKMSGRASEKYWEWENEHKQLARAQRITFFDSLHDAYEVWRQSKNVPKDLLDILNAAEFPDELPLLERGEFIDWDIRKGRSETATQLADFAQAIYPETRSDKSCVFEQAVFEGFDHARRDLAKFWNDTGRKLIDFKDLSEADLITGFSTHAREIRVLTYLEWALARRLRSEGPGKNWMFSLYKWAQDRGRAK